MLSIKTSIPEIFFLAHFTLNANFFQWMIRSGTALATLMRIFLSATVGIALAQRSWYTFRRKFISLGGINSLIAITTNPLNFFDFELLWRAKLAIFLGLLIWSDYTSKLYRPLKKLIEDVDFHLSSLYLPLGL